MSTVSSSVPAYIPAPELRASLPDFSSIPFFDELANSVTDLLIVLNDHRQIVYANQGMLTAVGAPHVDHVIGLRPGDALNCTHAVNCAEGCGASIFCTTCGAAKAIISGLNGEKVTQECRILREDGSSLDLQVVATPLLIDGARYLAFAIKDVSAVRRKEVLERIFFHDILNTAGLVMGYAELLQDDDRPEASEIGGQVFWLSRRLTDEIRAQYELVLAEHNNLAVQQNAVNPFELMQELAVWYRRHLLGRRATIVISPKAENILFTSDSMLMRRVLGNMIKNALEASEPGQTVTLDCQPAQFEDGREAVAFSVHNEGYIPRQVQLQIFKRSFSTKGNGRGLGTYSMKLLTEQFLQGKISFVSTRTDGTTFTALFPLQLKPRSE